MAIRGGFDAMRLLMEEPENDQYDSGADGILPECRSCRLHRPFDPVQTCVYRYCPYSVDEVSTLRTQPLRLVIVTPDVLREVNQSECVCHRNSQSEGRRW